MLQDQLTLVTRERDLANSKVGPNRKWVWPQERGGRVK